MAWPTTHQDAQDEITGVRVPNDYLRSGYYSNGAFAGQAAAGSGVSTTTAYARPFWILRRRAFDRIGVNVTTASTAGSGGLIQVGLYSSNGIPGTLLFEGSAVSSETTGAKEWVMDVTLDAGVYWVASRCVVSGCSIPVFSSGSNATPFVSAYTTPQTTNTNHAAMSATVTAGVAGMPAGTAYTTPTVTAPLVVLRAT
jgi:hypothetical protein